MEDKILFSIGETNKGIQEEHRKTREAITDIVIPEVVIPAFPEIPKPESVKQELVDILKAIKATPEEFRLDKIEKLLYTIIDKGDVDLSNIESLLTEIKQELPELPEFPEFKFNKDQRLKVEVDRAGGIPSVLGSENKEGVRVNPSTEDKQDELNAKVATEAKQDPLASYVTQAIDDYTTTSVTYFLKMKSDGTWLFAKIDETGNFPTFTYANVSNNATKTTYALALASVDSLTYGLLNTLTL